MVRFVRVANAGTVPVSRLEELFESKAATGMCGFGRFFLTAASIPLTFRLKWQRDEVPTLRCTLASHRQRGGLESGTLALFPATVPRDLSVAGPQVSRCNLVNCFNELVSLAMEEKLRARISSWCMRAK